MAQDCVANLLATQDLQAAGMGLAIPQTPDQPNKLSITTQAGDVKEFPCQKDKGLIKPPFYKDAHTIIAGVATHQLRALTEGEL